MPPDWQLALVLSFLVKYNQTLEVPLPQRHFRNILSQNTKRAHDVIAQMCQTLAKPMNGIVRQRINDSTESNYWELVLDPYILSMIMIHDHN